MLIETSRVMERKMYEAEKNNQGGDNIHSGGIAIVATAKRNGALHPSLQRCGIIDTALAMDPPDAQGRGDIIDALLDKVLVENGYETSNDSISENNNRNKLQEHLKSKKIPTAVYYPIPLNEHKPYNKYPVSKSGLDITYYLCKRVGVPSPHKPHHRVLTPHSNLQPSPQWTD